MRLGLKVRRPPDGRESAWQRRFGSRVGLGGVCLAGADLSGLDLSGFNLEGVDFSGVKRERLALGAIISRFKKGPPQGMPRPNLRGANLSGANLSGAFLEYADLRDAVLDNAVLKGARLFHADLGGARLQSAELPGAVLMEAVLDGADLRFARLKGADLQTASLQGDETILDRANLTKARLTKAKMKGASLESANLRGAFLNEADLREAMLAGANLKNADLQGAALQGACLYNAVLRGSGLERANLSGVDAQYADCRSARLRQASLQGADLRFADLREVNLLGLVRDGLSRVRLFRARLDGTQLSVNQLLPSLGDEQEGSLAEAREAYQGLRSNREQAGDYGAAAWAYVRERVMEKSCSAPWRARRFYGEAQLGDRKQKRLRASHPRLWWFYVRHTLKWVMDWLTELVCNYGEGPLRTLASIVVVFLCFAIIYWRAGLVNWVVQGGEGTVVLPARDLGAALLFSLGAMSTLDVPWLQPAAPWVGFVMGAETLLGIGLTGLLGFVLGNRIRRS
ncbi:MAG: pentapeptide repeat-containing protein [Anaerolineae bacterium]